MAEDYLSEGKSVVVGEIHSFSNEMPKCADYLLSDNTNADTEVRSKWVELAKKHSVPIRCVLFTASAEICEHNDVVRALNKEVCQTPHLVQL